MSVWQAQLPADPAQDSLRLCCLAADEQARYRRMGAPLRQRQFLWGRILLRQALAQATGLMPQHLRLACRADGKLYLVDAPQWHFSLSHAGQQLWAAVDTLPVGVDGEYLRPGRDVLAVARRTWPAGERAMLAATPPDARLLRFYTLWTRKEALAKASGTGLMATLALDVTQDQVTWGGQTWHFHSLATPEAYVATVACAAPGCMALYQDNWPAPPPS